MSKKKVFTADTLVTVAHFANVLATEGIETEIRNANLGGALGEVPFTEVWPQLWVKHALDAPRAREIIEEIRSEPEPVGEPWVCKACGTRNEYQFAVCWNCGWADSETPL
ncbi:MAG: DUF2007 domain-containing protein [Pseudomonadota bacterium]